MPGEDDGEIDRSPWCAGCDHSMPDRDHAHRRIRMDGRKIGPFCTRNCAFCWVIRNDERALNYLDFEAIGEGPELVTDGGRVEDADGVDRVECTECGSVEKYTLPNDGEIRDTCRDCGADALEVLENAQ